ncbi:MAG: septum formation inhibitor Maf [Gammaproteobacteria bacterium]|nr:septum formation inhibitor Maf [Gammaproteobacteria bacterium]
MSIILASASPHRRMLLQRLGLDFAVSAPEVDETPRPQEGPAALVQRLARAKAGAAAALHPRALLIGADQAAALDGAIIGKPGDHVRASAQLRAVAGQTLTFHTGLCVLDGRMGGSREHVDVTRVHFRALGEPEIERYLRTEQPYNCAGSFKSEGLGISLFERIESQDPTALVGLPLIMLCRFLREFGISLP